MTNSQAADHEYRDNSNGTMTTDDSVTVLADDAVDYCLNGEVGGSFEELGVGDFVGIRYYPDRQQKGILAPHT